MIELENFQFIVEQLTQVTQMAVQILQKLTGASIPPVESSGPPIPPIPPISVESPEDDLKFFGAHRHVQWDGGDCLFSYRKRKRYDLVAFLWEHVGEFVSAEEVAEAFFDAVNFKWGSIRRYVQRLQRDDQQFRGGNRVTKRLNGK